MFEIVHQNWGEKPHIQISFQGLKNTGVRCQQGWGNEEAGRTRSCDICLEAGTRRRLSRECCSMALLSLLGAAMLEHVSPVGGLALEEGAKAASFDHLADPSQRVPIPRSQASDSIFLGPKLVLIQVLPQVNERGCPQSMWTGRQPRAGAAGSVGVSACPQDALLDSVPVSSNKPPCGCGESLQPAGCGRTSGSPLLEGCDAGPRCPGPRHSP